MLLTFMENVWTIFRKDVRVWSRHPSNILITFLPPLALLLVGALGSAAVGHSPVALVRLDNGPDGARMVQIFHNADVFRIQDVDAMQAQVLLKNLDVVAVITIPPDFTQRVRAHESSPIDVTINNLNLDFTNDIRRSVPDVITQFYASQGRASLIGVSLREHDLRDRDIELFEYSVLPTIVFLLTISGLVTGGLTTAREWESQTVKELLLSPAMRGAIIIGKVLASFATTFCFGVLVICLGYAAGWVRPEGVYWLSALLVIALLSLLSSGVGIAVGVMIQRVQPLSPIAVNIGMYLFFLAGGVGVLAFEPVVLQNIAAFIPLTYGRHALEMAIFYHSSDQLVRDVVVLCISVLIAVSLGILAMRRGIAG
ncbi:MAG: ABC transporter permease [Ktedonobacteraceae bacterium]